MINVDQYPVLKSLLWDMQNVSELSEADAYLYYESRWRFVDEAESTCLKILTDNLEELHVVAKGLLEYETLSGDEIKDLIKGIPPTRDDFDSEDNDKEIKPTNSVPKTGEKISPQPQ